MMLNAKAREKSRQNVDKQELLLLEAEGGWKTSGHMDDPGEEKQ